MLTKDDITWLHVEPSSKCNAWCPACNRNNQGYGLAPFVIEQDLAPDKFEEIVSQFKNLKCIQLCGNLGDPIASEYISEIIDIAKKHSPKIQIHTNGSLRNQKWWKDLAYRLSDIEHDVWFGIDGIDSVHEIYRQGTSFKKIIKNAKAFIDNGGYATWQFIPYQHNEHQIVKCLNLSRQMNFQKFHLAKFYRPQTTARHYRTGEYFELAPSEKARALLKIDQPKTTVKLNNCMHLSLPSIYIDASGKVMRCCYLTKFEKYSTVDEMFSTVNTDLNDPTCISMCG